MVRGLVFAALFGLAACATPPSGEGAAPSAQPYRVTAPIPPAPAIAAFLARAGQADAPTLAQVEQQLGPADIARREGAGAVLTWRLETCALALGFSANNDRNEMRLAVANRAARLPGEATPSVEACGAELEARRARAPVG